MESHTTQEEVESRGYNWHGDYLYTWSYWLVFDGTEGATSYKITVDTSGYPNEYMENNNPWTASGMPGYNAMDDDPTIKNDYEAGKRFFLIGGQTVEYNPEDGPSYWYNVRDEIIPGVGNWTFNIVPQS